MENTIIIKKCSGCSYRTEFEWDEEFNSFWSVIEQILNVRQILSVWKCNLLDVVNCRHNDSFKVESNWKMSLFRRPKWVALFYLYDLLVSFHWKLCDFLIENGAISLSRIARFFHQKFCEFFIENFAIFSLRILRFFHWKFCDFLIANFSIFSTKWCDFFIENFAISSLRILRFIHRNGENCGISWWKFWDFFIENCAIEDFAISSSKT